MIDEDPDSMVNILLMLGGLTIYYLFRKNSGEYYINKGLFEAIIIFTLIVTAQTSFWWSRYKMPKVCVNGFNGSIGKRPFPCGEFFVFATGETFDPIHLEGKLATLVVPKRSVKRVGNSYVGSVKVQRWPLMELPPFVTDYIMNNKDKYNTQVVYFGEYTEEFEQKNYETISEKDAKIKKLQRINNEFSQLISNQDDVLEEKINVARKLAGKEKKKFSLFQRKEEDDG